MVAARATLVLLTGEMAPFPRTRLELLSGSRRRRDIEVQLMIGGVEPNPGPRARSAQPSKTTTTLKVSGMVMDVDEYKGKEHAARHRVTYVDRDSPFLEDRKPGQWSYRRNPVPRLKAPMSKFATLLDRYQEAIYSNQPSAAKAVAAQGKAWAENYPSSVFAQMASVSDWNRMSSAVYDMSVALDWHGALRENYEDQCDDLGLTPSDGTRRRSEAEWVALEKTCKDTTTQLADALREQTSMRQWWLSERETSRALQTKLDAATTELQATRDMLSQAELQLGEARRGLWWKDGTKTAPAEPRPELPEPATATAPPTGDTADLKAEMKTLRDRLAEAHETLFLKDAMLDALKEELQRVREGLGETSTRAHDALVPSDPPVTTTASAASDLPDTNVAPPTSPPLANPFASFLAQAQTPLQAPPSPDSASQLSSPHVLQYTQKKKSVMRKY